MSRKHKRRRRHKHRHEPEEDDSIRVGDMTKQTAKFKRFVGEKLFNQLFIQLVED